MVHAVPLPIVPPLIVGEVSVLLVRVCVPVSVATLAMPMPESMAVLSVAPVLLETSTFAAVVPPEPVILPAPEGVPVTM